MLTTRLSPRASRFRTLARSSSRPDGRGVWDRDVLHRRGLDGGGVGLGRGARLVEAFGEEGGQVAGHLVLEVGGRLEGEVGGGVVGADPVDELAEAVVAVCRRLDVDELGHGCRGEVVFVLESETSSSGATQP
jgi:hypothetical protein